MADELATQPAEQPEVQPPELPKPEPNVFDKYDETPQVNYFDKYDKAPDAGDPGLRERARLHAQESYYRGTIAGAIELKGLADLYKRSDEGVDPDTVKQRDGYRKQYDGIIADLARYDAMGGVGDIYEAGAALGGALYGGLWSPESYVGGGAGRGASVLLRTARAAGVQAVVTGAADPVVQAINISADVQQQYEPMRTVTAAGLGAIIGGGLHLATGELLPAWLVKRAQREHAEVDPQMRSADTEAAKVTPEQPHGPTTEGTAQATAEGLPKPEPAPTPVPGAVELPEVVVKPPGAPEAAPKPVARTPAGEAPGYLIYTSEGGPVAAAQLTPEQKATYGAPQESFKPAAFSDQTGEVFAAPDGKIESAIKLAEAQGVTPDSLKVGSVNAIERGETPELQAIAQRKTGALLAMEAKRPAAGVPATIPPPGAPVPSPQQEVAIRSLQQQTFDLAAALDIPVREGRVQLRGALGTFNKQTGVVRVKEVPDFAVVSHEAGHAIEAKAGQPLTDLIDNHAHELGPMDYDKSQMRPTEGFAEFIRHYIQAPAYAQKQAPGFSAEFQQLMQANHPEILAGLDNAQTAFKAYHEAPSVDAVGAVRRSVDETPKTLIGRAAAFIRENGFFPSVKMVMQNAYAALFDRDAPVARAVRDLTQIIRDQNKGQLVDLKAADNPEILQRLFARSEQAAVLDLNDGVRPYHSVTPEGNSLSSAIAKATGEPSLLGKWDSQGVAEFDTYLIARRAEYLWRKHEAGELPNPPAAFSKADSITTMSELERNNPTFREASDMVHDWTRQLLRKQFEGGLITNELYQKLLGDEFYVPFMRDLSDKPLAGGLGTASLERVSETVQRMRGSARDIKSPLESLMMQSFLVNRALKHNDIILALEKLAAQAGTEGGKFFEQLPAHEARKYTFDLKDAVERLGKEKGIASDDIDLVTSTLTNWSGSDPLIGSFFRSEVAGARGEPIVFYKKNGQVAVGRVMSGSEGHAIYETLTALPSGLQDVGAQLLSISSAVLRSGVTTNPVYMLTNYIRDQMAVGILRSDYIPFLSGFKGLYSEVAQTESAKLYGYAGGVSAGASIAPLQRAAEANINALAKQGYLVNRLTSLQGLTELASLTEAATRNSVFEKVFKAKKAESLSDYEAMIEAAYSAQDTLDFSRWGSKTSAIRALTPFVNAWAQGMDKWYRTAVEPLVRQATTTADKVAVRNALITNGKLVVVGGALGAGWAALHSQDEVYQDASPELKGTHFVTSIGGKVVVIPKPFELSIGFTAGEFAYQRLMKEDPRAASQFAQAAYQVLVPPVPFFANPLIKTTGELIANYSTFTGRAIVPDRLARLDVSQRVTDRTTSLAKTVGGLINVAPIKVDHAIGGYFGTNGRDIAAFASSADPDAPVHSQDNWVFLRRFIKDPTRSSDITKQFWNFMGQTTGKFNQAVNSYDALVKGFREPQAAEFLSRLPENERAYVTLQSAADESGKPAFDADTKRVHPLRRAYDAVTVLNGLRGEMSDNSFRFTGTGEPLKLDPTKRGQLIDLSRELAQKEMRNSLVIMKEPGYGDRPLMKLNDTMDKIKAISPQVADEIATRYATGKIYTTESVAKSYRGMQSEVLRNGSQADLGDYVADAAAEGYEFGGERVTKPKKRRAPIPASPGVSP